MFYIRKPVLVEAEEALLPGSIETLEGTMSYRAGDFIIEGTWGEKYPCRREIFEGIYSPTCAPEGASSDIILKSYSSLDSDEGEEAEFELTRGDKNYILRFIGRKTVRDLVDWRMTLNGIPLAGGTSLPYQAWCEVIHGVMSNRNTLKLLLN